MRAIQTQQHYQTRSTVLNMSQSTSPVPKRARKSPPGRNILSLIHISEPTRRYAISYAVFCLKK